MATNETMIKVFKARVGVNFQPSFYTEIDSLYKGNTDNYIENLYGSSIFASLTKALAFVDNPSKEQLENDPASKMGSAIMAITSPDYVKKLQEKQNEEENGYKQLYTSYKEGKFAEAMQQATTAIAKYPDSGLQAKYHLILAICQGSDKNLAAYRNALAEVTKKFPTTEEAAKAKEMIANLNNIELKLAQNTGITENNKPEVTPEKPSVNYIDSDTEQYFVAVVSNKLDLNRIKFNIVSFNLDSYLNLNLNVSSTQLNQSFNVILVETLKDKATSMDYFKNIGEAPATFLNAPPEECVFFVISKQNYAQFIADKGIQNYMAFFRQHYKP